MGTIRDLITVAAVSVILGDFLAILIFVNHNELRPSSMAIDDRVRPLAYVGNVGCSAKMVLRCTLVKLVEPPRSFFHSRRARMLGKNTAKGNNPNASSLPRKPGLALGHTTR